MADAFSFKPIATFSRSSAGVSTYTVPTGFRVSLAGIIVQQLSSGTVNVHLIVGGVSVNVMSSDAPRAIGTKNSNRVQTASGQYAIDVSGFNLNAGDSITFTTTSTTSATGIVSGLEILIG